MREKKEKNRKEREVEGVGNPGKWVALGVNRFSPGAVTLIANVSRV